MGAPITMFLRSGKGMGGWRGGSQSSSDGIRLKLEFAVLITPILASFSFRGLPWTSAGNGEPSPHILLGRRQQSTWESAGSQTFRADNYIKLQFSAPFIPILASVGFRQIPSASVGSR